MNTSKKILISAGDASGDLHASNLAREIKKLDKNINISALGGKRLSEVCNGLIYDLVDLNVHGFWEPVKQYLNLKRVYRNLVIKHIDGNKPDAVVLVDYYGFNIKIAEYASSLKIPVYYFISPQVWASRYKRIEKIRKYVNHMFVIFPFEEEMYRKENVPVTFIGHPFLDSIPECNFTEPAEPGKGSFCVGFFPGSRRQVIAWNMPVMEETAQIIRKELNSVKFIVFGMSDMKGCYNTSMEVVYDAGYNERKQVDLAISVSGTVTLENALLGIPMIVMYRLPWLMYHFIKSIVLVSKIGIVNIIEGRQVIPELIQKDAKPENIAGLAVRWLKEPQNLLVMKKEFANLRGMLGRKGAYERLAKTIVDKIK